MNIRSINIEKDYNTLNYWCISGLNHILTKDMIPEETTFIVEDNNKPIASACLYLMNCKSGCMVENVLSNPTCEKSQRHNAVDLLFNYIENLARDKGYNKLIILSINDKVKNRYQELGFKKTCDNITSFAKELI